MEYSLYNKKVYCKSNSIKCIQGPRGLKGEVGKTETQYTIIYFHDIFLKQF